jgi:hypothetical protein
MLVDCDSCVVRGTACGGCVISVMLGAAPDGVELDADEHRALRVLADAGMVPELRLVPPGRAQPEPGCGGGEHAPRLAGPAQRPAGSEEPGERAGPGSRPARSRRRRPAA